MPSPVEQHAIEALAIHHEHRARDLDRARGYAEALDAAVTGKRRLETERRLRRLARKQEGSERERPAGLWHDPVES